MAAYKVLDFNESSGQLTIEFAQGTAPISVDVPIKDGLYVTGEELDTYIQGFIPTWYIERQAQINQGVANAQELKALAEQTTSVAIPTVLTAEQQQALDNKKMWEAVDFERDVAKVLIKFGVLTSDPTIIPVSEQ
jgi:uncharacterized membrane protein YfbV (UPF0208 family)